MYIYLKGVLPHTLLTTCQGTGLTSPEQPFGLTGPKPRTACQGVRVDKPRSPFPHAPDNLPGCSVES